MVAAIGCGGAGSDQDPEGGTSYYGLPRTQLPPSDADPNHLSTELPSGDVVSYQVTLVQPTAGLSEYYSAAPERAAEVLADLIRQSVNCESPVTTLNPTVSVMARDQLVDAYCEVLGETYCREGIMDVFVQNLGCQ